MQYVLTGFRQTLAVRHYAFQAIGADRTRSEVIVDADMDLVRKYSIPVQELPLLCRRLLEGTNDESSRQGLVFSERDMMRYAEDRASAEQEAAAKRRKHRVPLAAKAGQAWR